MEPINYNNNNKRNYDQFNNDSTSRFGAKIQTVFRMNVNNQEAEAANILVNLTKKSEEKEAAIKIQSVARGYLDRQLVKAKLERAKILKNQEDCPISHEHLTMSKSSVTDCCGCAFDTTSLLQWATIANSNTCPNCRSEINIHDLLQDQLSIKNFKSALQIADTITNEKAKSLALLDISQFYLKNGNHEEALKIAASITFEGTKTCALNGICQFLVKHGNTKEAINVAKAIPNDNNKSSALLFAFFYLIDKNGKSKEATDVALNIPDVKFKSIALNHICEKLFNIGYIDRAIGIANSIPDETLKRNALYQIETSLMKDNTIYYTNNTNSLGSLIAVIGLASLSLGFIYFSNNQQKRAN